MWHRFVWLILIVLIAGGCTNSPRSDSQSGPSPKATEEVKFAEAVTVPVAIKGKPGNLRVTEVGVVSVMMINHRRANVRITQIALKSDAGLKAEFLGHTTCNKGCAGADVWNEETQKLVARSLEGRLPIDLPSEVKKEFAVIRLTVETEEAAERLVSSCGLFVREAIVTLSSGERLRLVAGSSEYIAGVTPAPPLPEGATECLRPGVRAS